MANERMTISDLVSKAKNIRETAGRLDKLNAVMQTDVRIHDTVNRAMKETQGLEHEIVYLLNGASSTLSEYADLLEKIMRKTQVPWPPTVEIQQK